MQAVQFPSMRWPVVLFAWGLLALAFLPQALVINLNRPEPLPLWVVSVRNLSIFFLWAAFTPLGLWAVHRWPPIGSRRWRNIARLVGVAIALCVLHLLAMTAITLLSFDAPAGAMHIFIGSAMGLGATNLLMAGVLFTAGVAMMQWQARRDAERQLSEARLAALSAQLQPHFLFNTLNALAELVHADAARAESLLLKLSQLLRRALDEGTQPRVTLREELDFLDDYLDIQQALFGERLRISREIDPGALQARLPPMLLQPLVENALRHGFGSRREAGLLSIRAVRQPDALQLTVSDDGVGATLPVREGVGLRNTRERLATGFAGQARLQLDSSPGEGFCVVVTMPQERT